MSFFGHRKLYEIGKWEKLDISFPLLFTLPLKLNLVVASSPKKNVFRWFLRVKKFVIFIDSSYVAIQRLLASHCYTAPIKIYSIRYVNVVCIFVAFSFSNLFSFYHFVQNMQPIVFDGASVSSLFLFIFNKPINLCWICMHNIDICSIAASMFSTMVAPHA